MFKGYLAFGDTEIINTARTVGYTETATDCSISWLKCPPCDGLADALGETQPYVYGNISEAPWYDADIEATHRFLGVHGLLFEGLPGSTRAAEVSEGVLDGGVVGQVRHATRRVRVEAVLSAQGEDALEAGMAWLDAALRPNRCHESHSHGDGCSPHADVQIFTACPPTAAQVPDPEDYLAVVEDLTRFMHTVTAVAGPTVVEEFHNASGAWGYLVEFVLVAATPWLHGLTREVASTPSLPVIVQDVPFNLVPYPSAELALGTVVASVNFSANPSVEVDATGWAATSSVVLPANVTGARSTDLASVGGASYRSRFVATNSGTAGKVNADNTSAVFAPTVAGQRMSVNMWATAIVESGTAVLGSVGILAVWRSGSTELRTDVIGTVATGGGAVTSKSIAVPVGTTNVIMRAQANLNSWSSGAVVNLYGDAVAVTVP